MLSLEMHAEYVRYRVQVLRDYCFAQQANAGGIKDETNGEEDAIQLVVLSVPDGDTDEASNEGPCE